MTAPTSPGVVPADVRKLAKKARDDFGTSKTYKPLATFVEQAIMADRANRPSLTENEREQVRREALEDDHLFWFLRVLNACGSYGASCADDPWEWVGAFCADFEPTDTFNRAIKMKLAGWSHNSDTDEARTCITDAGKTWLADRHRFRALARTEPRQEKEGDRG